MKRAAETRTFWPKGGTGQRDAQNGGIEDMLRWMDKAQRIVTHTQGIEDACAIWKMYEGDKARHQAHMLKTTDVGVEVHRITGRAYTLEDILRANGHEGYVSNKRSTEEWWRKGDTEQIAIRSRTSTRALARVVTEKVACLPGKQETASISIRSTVLQRAEPQHAAREPQQDKRKERETSTNTSSGEDSRNEEDTVRQRRNAPSSANGKDEASSSSTPMNAGETTSIKRKRSAPANYDEVKRKDGGKKLKPLMYIDTAPRRRGKRDRIVAGAATLDRTAGTRYEWKDDAHTEKRRRT